MLARLEIRDFALIREAHLDLAPGFNVLTGATGVGKTLVLAALDLLLGARARTDRLGPEASVAGLFHLEPDLADAAADLAEAEIEDGELLVRRKVTEGGRNRCRRRDERLADSWEMDRQRDQLRAQWGLGGSRLGEL